MNLKWKLQMTKPKIYHITESQFKALIEKKKQEKVTFNRLIEEIKVNKATLNEASAINESVVTILKKYMTNEPMSKSLVESLLSSKHVTVDHLKAAGIPETTKSPEML